MSSPSYSVTVAIWIAVVSLFIRLLREFLRFAIRSIFCFLIAGATACAAIIYLRVAVAPPFVSWAADSLVSLPLGVPLLALESLVVLFFFGRWLMLFTQPNHPVISKGVRVMGVVFKVIAANLLAVLGVLTAVFALAAQVVNEYYWWHAVQRFGKEPFFLVTVGVMSASFFAWLLIHEAMQVEQVLDAERTKQMCASCRDFDPRPYFDDEEVFVGREV